MPSLHLLLISTHMMKTAPLNNCQPIMQQTGHFGGSLQLNYAFSSGSKGEFTMMHKFNFV